MRRAKIPLRRGWKGRAFGALSGAKASACFPGVWSFRAGRGALGDGGGDGFVWGVGLFWKVYRLGHICEADEFYFGDAIRPEGVGGLAGLGFFPGAEEELAGLWVGAEAVGVDEALGAIVVDEEGRAGADERGKGVGSGVDRLGLRGRRLGLGGGRGAGRGVAAAEEKEQATDYQASEHRAGLQILDKPNRSRR